MVIGIDFTGQEVKCFKLDPLFKVVDQLAEHELKPILHAGEEFT